MSEDVFTTSQMTACTPFIVSGGDENIMVWNGLDNAVNISTSPLGTFDFPSSKTAFKSYGGPSLVMFPSGDKGYLFWTGQTKVEDGYQLYYAEVLKDSEGTLSVSPTSHEVTPVICLDKAVAVMLTTQNGQLVINIAWQNTHKYLCLTQIQPWKKIQTGWSEIQLDQKTHTGPTMVTINGRPAMAYFDDNKHLNIVLAPRNTLNFDIHNRLIFKGISSNYAPAMVVQSVGIGYVFWIDVSNSKLSYNQIGMNARGSIALNTQPEGSGTIKDATSTTAPSARMVNREQDGQHATLLQVVWSQSGKNYIKIAEFEPHHTALS